MTETEIATIGQKATQLAEEAATIEVAISQSETARVHHPKGLAAVQRLREQTAAVSNHPQDLDHLSMPRKKSRPTIPI